MVKMWSKKETQRVLHALRRAGFRTEKDVGGYTVYDGDDLIMRALLANSFYIIRHDEDLFDYKEQ